MAPKWYMCLHIGPVSDGLGLQTSIFADFADWYCEKWEDELLYPPKENKGINKLIAYISNRTGNYYSPASMLSSQDVCINEDVVVSNVP